MHNNQPTVWIHSFMWFSPHPNRTIYEVETWLTSLPEGGYFLTWVSLTHLLTLWYQQGYPLLVNNYKNTMEYSVCCTMGWAAPTFKNGIWCNVSLQWVISILAVPGGPILTSPMVACSFLCWWCLSGIHIFLAYPCCSFLQKSLNDCYLCNRKHNNLSGPNNHSFTYYVTHIRHSFTYYVTHTCHLADPQVG